MKKPKILLVDDDEVYLFVTKKILNNLSEDLIINAFTDGEQAIEYIDLCLKENIELPELILLDINMPFLDGWGFLAEFKKMKLKLEEQNVTIFMITSSNDPSDLKKVKDFEEISGYIVKPVFEDKMEEILKTVYNGSL
ncbi:response regulator [Allomuricauda sp. F6463D]|uniref:response regulator n=1 Tax=Allomuricauda sp. F6463D TaxID=2926409 RepID=UPI001FF520E1|nr:response regulator [Muricauda sp. F6463D]MCK0159990.1 response regulator [Muricauda sp. F6463D]